VDSTNILRLIDEILGQQIPPPNPQTGHHFPDPIREEEVEIEFKWTADERTRQALERQAALMGFESRADYLHQLIAATLAGNDQSTRCRAERPT
jgi:hypothetical protein